jgi:hypothetical protein
MEAEILRDTCFHLAAILEIQDDRHNVSHLLSLNGIVVLLDSEYVGLDTKIEAVSGLETQILRNIGFQLGAILEIQDGRHNVSHLMFLNFFHLKNKYFNSCIL